MMSTLDPEIKHLLALAFPAPPDVISLSDASQGRGVFSRVLRAELSWPGGRGDRPGSVALKLPAAGSNGRAALASGAYEREALAYERLLPGSPIRFPYPYLVSRDGRGSASFVLEDLTDHRAADQLDGLGAEDCLRMCRELRLFHDSWQARAGDAHLGVRRSVPSSIDPTALAAGLATLTTRWRDELGTSEISAFTDLVANRDAMVDAFAGAGGVTLCHGDPRADNVRFESDGRPVFFDWQQLAVQPGSADLAWLAATSLTPATRRRLDRSLVDGYGTSFDAYRRGFVLPGLAVLLLAQREADSRRAAEFVAVSLRRIGTALADLDVPGLRSP
jgi:hypothetical protein